MLQTVLRTQYPRSCYCYAQNINQEETQHPYAPEAEEPEAAWHNGTRPPRLPPLLSRGAGAFRGARPVALRCWADMVLGRHETQCHSGRGQWARSGRPELLALACPVALFACRVRARRVELVGRPTLRWSGVGPDLDPGHQLLPESLAGPGEWYPVLGEVLFALVSDMPQHSLPSLNSLVWWTGLPCGISVQGSELCCRAAGAVPSSSSSAPVGHPG